MRVFPPSLAAKLRGRVTTVCWCWRVIRKDGAVLGFTDHDRALMFDGTTFEASSGFTGTEMMASVGLNVDNLEVDGALTSDKLSDADLAGGVFDDARVEIFLVDWQDVDDRVLMRIGSLGEVKRGGGAFTAEVRGLAHYLQQPSGRLYQAMCDADLGDGRCQVDLTNPAYKGTGAVVEVISERTILVSGLGAFAEGWFRQGLVTFTSGAPLGQSMEVKAHGSRDQHSLIDLWAPVRGPLQVDVTLDITAGCDKLHATCRDRFSNAVNFQGFPFMPGNDFIAKVAGSGS
ncbi:MAG: DUF2163 domain-containing protein [Pseudomonadota bacterium]